MATRYKIYTAKDNAVGGALSILPLFAPEGFLINGKIVPSVSSNNLTVAIKGMDGNDPSATNPVYCRINATVRAITAALSVTINAGTNWCNAGSSELATKEIDYFVYLGYNATDGVVVGFSRIPYANSYDDFSTTSTNEKYCAISTITNAAATDYYHVIGRFAATLSAGAGYTWTVPTFTAKNLIQRPIYETRRLTWVPTWGGYSSAPTGTYLYEVIGRTLRLHQYNLGVGTSNAITNTVTIPFVPVLAAGDTRQLGFWSVNNGANQANSARLDLAASATLTFYLDGAGNVWTNANAKFVSFDRLVLDI